jgi:serine protease
MTQGSRRGPGSTGLVSFALAIAVLSLVTSLSPGESSRGTSEQATGSSLASASAPASSVGTVYPPSTRFSPQGPYLAGSVLIGFHSGVSAAQRHAIEHAAGALGARRMGPVLKPVGHGRVTGAEYLSPYELRVPDGLVFSAAARLRRDPGVAYAEPNYLERASAIEPPNDPFFSKQWGDENIGQKIQFQNGNEELGAEENGTPGADDHALAAWNSLEALGKTVGSSSIVIGEVDTGVDYTHPDLKANIWSNPGGIGQNEKKEHICAAGTRGYNVLNETCNPMDEDKTYGGHGTHVAGIMGAEGNNKEGVAGMNWQTTILRSDG